MSERGLPLRTWICPICGYAQYLGTPCNCSPSPYDGSLADSYSWANRTPAECLTAARSIEERAFAAGREQVLRQLEAQRDRWAGIDDVRWRVVNHAIEAARSTKEPSR